MHDLDPVTPDVHARAIKWAFACAAMFSASCAAAPPRTDTHAAQAHPAASASSSAADSPRGPPADVTNLAELRAGDVRFWAHEPVLVLHVQHSIVVRWDQIAEGGEVRTQDVSTADGPWRKGRWAAGDPTDLAPSEAPDSAWGERFAHPTTVVLMNGKTWIAAPQFSRVFLDNLKDAPAPPEDEEALVATAAGHFRRHIGADGVYQACDHPIVLGVGAGVLARGLRRGLR